MGLGVMISEENLFPGRDEEMPVHNQHYVNCRVIKPPFPNDMETVLFGMGCFWGAERLFWQVPGVYSTAVGYAGGFVQNPHYREVCTGATGHAEVVLVVFDPKVVTFDALLKHFWESHDPTQGMRQGNDIGSQYRSAIYCSSAQQLEQAKRSRELYEEQLLTRGYSQITTEVVDDIPFFYAEQDHQQYLAKNPMGYCGLKGTGVLCPS